MHRVTNRRVREIKHSSHRKLAPTQIPRIIMDNIVSKKANWDPAYAILSLSRLPKSLTGPTNRKLEAHLNPRQAASLIEMFFYAEVGDAQSFQDAVAAMPDELSTRMMVELARAEPARALHLAGWLITNRRNHDALGKTPSLARQLCSPLARRRVVPKVARVSHARNSRPLTVGRALTRARATILSDAAKVSEAGDSPQVQLQKLTASVDKDCFICYEKLDFTASEWEPTAIVETICHHYIHRTCLEDLLTRFGGQCPLRCGKLWDCRM